MVPLPLSLLALSAALAAPAYAVTPLGFEDGGHTLVSAMMMFVGNEEKVYIMDKAEGNAAQVNNHPAWGSVWDMKTRTAEVMEIPSNIFCSSGIHFPNGSYAAFGGNGAVGPGGNMGSVPNPGGWSAAWDATYQNLDGSRAIRVLNPCTSTDDMNSVQCRWFDDPATLAMKRMRWYSTAEALADGSVVLIGGFSTGGYINRNYPNREPNGGGSQNTFEFYPPRAEDPPLLPFLTRTSGLNAYVHAFLMPSGAMFLQANISTTLWNYNDNTETPLPEMPGGVVRVYPASGAVAMLPLTPANNYNPTIIFCGGSDMKDEQWGNFSYPFIDTWNYPASKDCQRITPEPVGGAAPVYEQDDDMPEGRSMGQFIILPDGKLLVVNGALNGTAGYAQRTLTIERFEDMPFGESLASGPVLTPAIYDPNAPRGQRWSNAGFQASKIPRMYHSSAVLLPDASVLIAGSNPNVDVNLDIMFPTTYAAEIFYPPYFTAKVRPSPTGVPKKLSYGGQPFDITIPASSYSGSSNDAAKNTTVSIIRQGFTTHAMNMGQRYLQLENTYTVKDDGTIILHVAQLPSAQSTPNVFQPGPAFLFVTVNGIPSNGTHLIIGSGAIGAQTVSPAVPLPASVLNSNAKGTASGASISDKGGDDKGSVGDKSNGDQTSGMSTTTIIGIAAGAGVLLLLAGLGGYFYMRNKRANAAKAGGLMTPAPAFRGRQGDSDMGSFVPLNQGNHSSTWNNSTADLQSPYTDHPQQGQGAYQRPYQHNAGGQYHY